VGKVSHAQKEEEHNPDQFKSRDPFELEMMDFLDTLQVFLNIC
jgi:hypothetical protein